MYCSSCGEYIQDGALFCPNCGASVKKEAAPVQQSIPYPVQPVDYNSGYSTQKIPTVGSYIGWTLLSCIPIVGFILAIVFACDKSYKARQNYFKAELLMIVIAIAIGIILGVVSALTGVSFTPDMSGADWLQDEMINIV